MSRCFDAEIADASAARERALDRDHHREPRRPRYPSSPERSRQIAASFRTLLGDSAPAKVPYHCPICASTHEAIMADEARWLSLPLVGYLEDEADDGSTILLELRDMPCRSTMSVPVAARRAS